MSKAQGKNYRALDQSQISLVKQSLSSSHRLRALGVHKMRKRTIEPGLLVQHMDNRQGRVMEVGLLLGGLPAARIKWFRGAEEIVIIGYIWVTSIEENE